MVIDSSEPVVRTAADRPLDEAVVKAIAEMKETPPLELDVRLFDAIDGDALNHLFRRHSGDATVTFSLDGCEITVGSDGRIVVTDALNGH